MARLLKPKLKLKINYDVDKDGVLNWRDCAPLNKKYHFLVTQPSAPSGPPSPERPSRTPLIPSPPPSHWTRGPSGPPDRRILIPTKAEKEKARRATPSPTPTDPRTITQQITPSRISTYAPSEQRFRLTPFEATKQTIQKIARGEFRGAFSPFELVGDIKAEQEVKTDISPMWRGTITSPESTPLVYQSTEGITFGELAKRREIMAGGDISTLGLPVEVKAQREQERIVKEIRPTYQKKVDEGLELEKAQEQFQKEFEKRYKPKEEKIIRVSKQLKETGLGYEQLGVTTGQKGLEVAPTVAKVGLIGAGTIVAPQVTGGYLAYEGFKGATKAYGEAILGKELTKAERAKLYGLGTISLGVGVIGVGATTKAIESQILREELKTLGGQRLKYDSIQLEGGREGTIILKGTKQFKGLKQDIKLVGRFTRKGKKIYLPSGKGQAITTGEFTGWTLKTGQPTKILAGQEFTFGAKGVGLPVSEKVGVSLGRYGITRGQETSALYFPRTPATKIAKQLKRGLYTPSEKTATGYFGGVSYRLKKDLFLGRGGRAGRTTLQGSRITFNIPKTESVGLTKVIRLKDKGVGFDIIGGAGKGGRLVGRLAPPSLSPTPALTAVSSRIQPSMITPKIKPVISGAGVTGVTSGAIKQIQTPRITQRQIPKLAVAPVTKQRQRVITKLSSKQKAKTKQKTKLITLTGLKQPQALRSRTALASALGQKQIQKQIQRQVQMPRLVPSIITAPISPLRPPPLTPKIPIPLAKPIIPQFRKGRKAPQLFKQPARYQVSLTGTVFKFKGRPKKLLKGYSPFRVRGFAKKKRRKKKKKK